MRIDGRFLRTVNARAKNEDRGKEGSSLTNLMKRGTLGAEEMRRNKELASRRRALSSARIWGKGVTASSHRMRIRHACVRCPYMNLARTAKASAGRFALIGPRNAHDAGRLVMVPRDVFPGS